MPETWFRARRGAAEFILIAVGVFAGLAADEWRQQRSDRAEEVDYVQRLIDDLEYDIRGRELVDSVSVAKLPALIRLAGAEDYDGAGGNAQVAADLEAATVDWAWAPFPYRRNTFDELVSTGRLGLISDASARDALSAYYTSLEGQLEALLRRREAANLNRLAFTSMPSPAARSALGSSRTNSADLTRQLDVNGLRDAATAELNLVVTTRNFMASLNERALQLIDLLEQTAARQ